MNIRPNLEAGAALPREVARSGSSASAHPSSGNTAPTVLRDGDTAKLSDAARAASSSDQVRTEKVASIQQALSRGTYAVNPLDVAGKLLDHLLGN